MSGGDAAGDAGVEQKSGAWIGVVRGVTVREPGPDADGPILEIHGEDGLVAMEFDDPAFVEGLTHTAGEMNLLFEEGSA